MKINVFSWATSFLVINFLVRFSPALATSSIVNLSEAGKFVQSTIDEVRNTVTTEKGKLTEQELDKKLKEVIYRAFDLEKISRSCLAANWAKANPEEQKEFVSLFSDLMADTYLTKIKQNIEKSKVSFATDVVEDGRARVKTIANDGKDDFTIEYRLFKNDNQWRVYDVLIENESFVSTKRIEFAEIIRREKISGLLRELRAKAKK